MNILKEAQNHSNLAESLGPVTFHLMQEFTKNSLTSAYQIHKSSRDSEDGEVSYKNTSKKIHKLKAAGLIKIKKRDNTKHRAVYYDLTSLGIYYIFLRGPIIHQSLPSIISNYGSDELFKNLLYPYIRRETLLKIRSLFLEEEIKSYLSASCKRIDRMIREIQIVERPGIRGIPILDWHPIASEPTVKFLPYIKNRFDLILDKDFLVTRTDNETRIEIKDGIHCLSVELNRSKTKAKLLNNGEKVFEFDVRPSDLDASGLVLCDPEGLTAESIISESYPFLISYIDGQLGKMIFSWVTKYKFYMLHFRHRREEIKNDLRILGADKKFMEVLRLLSSTFSQCSTELIDLT